MCNVCRSLVFLVFTFIITSLKMLLKKNFICNTKSCIVFNVTLKDSRNLWNQSKKIMTFLNKLIISKHVYESITRNIFYIFM